MTPAQRPLLPPAERRADRLTRLRGLVARSGPIRLADAAAEFSLSSMTLRRDVETPGSGLLLLGGHIIPSGSSGDPRQPYVLEHERDQHAAAKREAGRHAAALVKSGETIFVDCGTTMPHLVDALPPQLEVTVICYALNVAAIVCARPRSQVVMLGGVFYRSSATFTSEDALRALDRVGINRAFLSAGGLHETRGASCSHFHEVPIKQAAMRRAVENCLVIDRSKLGLVRPAPFAAKTEFDRIVTEDG